MTCHTPPHENEIKVCPMKIRPAATSLPPLAPGIKKQIETKNKLKQNYQMQRDQQNSAICMYTYIARLSTPAEGPVGSQRGKIFKCE